MSAIQPCVQRAYIFFPFAHSLLLYVNPLDPCSGTAVKRMNMGATPSRAGTYATYDTLNSEGGSQDEELYQK